MEEMHENKEDSDFVVKPDANNPNDNTPNLKKSDKYQTLETKNINPKKKSIISIGVIIFEVGLILLALILTFKKAMNIVMRKNEVKELEMQLNQKKYNSPNNEIQENKEEKIPEKNENQEQKSPENKEQISTTSPTKNIKVGLCTPCKKENRYLRDFVLFYEKMGVDKIFLYDNNDVDGEKLEEVVNDFINNGLIEVSDWRGKNRELISMMDDCYQKNYQNYDWLIFYEVDEYVHLKNYTNIKNFLNEERFNNCSKIYLNWVFHTDNNLIHYDNRSVQERFPETEPIPENKQGYHNFIKTIIRGHLQNIKIDCVHRLVRDMVGCNGYGKEAATRLFRMIEQDFENYYIDHYFCKSVDEFIDKLNRGDAIRGQDDGFKVGTFGNYFGYNNMTIEKVEYVENRTNLNLSEFKKILIERNKNN